MTILTTSTWVLGKNSLYYANKINGEKKCYKKNIDTFWSDWEKCCVFFFRVYWLFVLKRYYVYGGLKRSRSFVFHFCDVIVKFDVCRRQCLVKQCSPQAIHNALQSCNQQYALSMPIYVYIHIHTDAIPFGLLYTRTHTMRSMLIISAQETHRCTARDLWWWEKRKRRDKGMERERKRKNETNEKSTHIYPPSWLYHWL